MFSVAVALLTRITLMVADLIVILVTWTKMGRQAWDAMRLDQDMKVITSMLTDGASTSDVREPEVRTI